MKIFRVTAIYQISSGYLLKHMHWAGGAPGNTDEEAYTCSFLRSTDEVYFMSSISPKHIYIIYI